MLTNAPVTPKGMSGDTQGLIAVDNNYIYSCTSDYSATTITTTGATHVLNKNGTQPWMDYYSGNNGDYFLQGGLCEDEVTPLAGWYVVDDNGAVRQILSDSVWFSDGDPTPIQNGGAWFLVLDGPFSISESNASIVLYEELPEVTLGSGDIWTSKSFEKSYKAIINQTDSLEGNNLGNFGEGFVIGEFYTIDTYESGDDFGNVADVISGNINTSGCYFRATGMTPSNWSNNSYLYSDGSLVVNELENNLGVNIYWDYVPFGGEGYGYIYAEDNTGIFVDLKDLGVPFATLQNTYPNVCCYPAPSFSVQYSNWYGGMVFNTFGIYGGWDNYNGMLWDSSFELKLFPNGGSQMNPPMLSQMKTKLKTSDTTPRTPRVRLSGVTENPTQTIVKNATSSMTKEEFRTLLKSRR